MPLTMVLYVTNWQNDRQNEQTVRNRKTAVISALVRMSYLPMI